MSANNLGLELGRRGRASQNLVAQPNVVQEPPKVGEPIIIEDENQLIEDVIIVNKKIAKCCRY